MRPLQTPNLPQKKVRAAVMQPCAAADRLCGMGLTVLSPLPNITLPAETACHADMLLCHAGGSTVFLEPAQALLAASLCALGFDVRFSAPLGRVYPADVPLNVAVGKRFALGNFKYADPALHAFLEHNGVELVSVRQGYAKCSLCFVAENAFITEDAGIATALRSVNADVLPVSAGEVALSKAHTGFFGGAAGLVAPDTLAVNGRLDTHRDGGRIRAFLANYGVRALELTDGKITDIGGILPLTEE